MMASTRDPYPFPTLQNDENFVGSRNQQQKPHNMPTHLAQKEGPWHRLNSTSTLTSARREVYHFDPKAPHDSLDFVLKSHYNHHKEFLKAGNETLVQPETLGVQHGRVLKNRHVMIPEVEEDLKHPLRICSSPKKENVHSVKKAIDGHRTQTTNRGYSRKPDGGFFTA